ACGAADISCRASSVSIIGWRVGVRLCARCVAAHMAPSPVPAVACQRVTRETYDSLWGRANRSQTEFCACPNGDGYWTYFAALRLYFALSRTSSPILCIAAAVSASSANDATITSTSRGPTERNSCSESDVLSPTTYFS